MIMNEMKNALLNYDLMYTNYTLIDIVYCTEHLNETQLLILT